jgi:hypothetical protein
MTLAEALKTSLQEIRMQMLGVQVLFGFQFQGLFQDNFSALPFPAHIVDAAALAMMVAVLGLLIGVACQHRIVDRGETTARVFAVSLRYAMYSLPPLIGIIGCDIFVAVAVPFGLRRAAKLGALSCVVASLMWYGLAFALRKETLYREVPMQQDSTPLHAKIEQMLTEARVVLPGVQAMLGFQLIVMLSKTFIEVPVAVRLAHLFALLSLALSIILLVAPAAIHRLTFKGNDHPRMHTVGSMLVAVALLPLACAISCDIWIAFTRLFADGWAPLSAAASSFLLLLSLWYLWPLRLRLRYGREGLAA